MEAVWKYPVATGDLVIVEMPAGARILKVGQQRIDLCVWALVQTDKPTVTRRIQIRGTGGDATGVGPYINTFEMYGGELVFHAFDGGEG